jgi:hypothetical protein
MITHLTTARNILMTTTKTDEFFPQIKAKIANLLTFLNMAPDDRKAKHREDLAGIRLALWDHVEAQIEAASADEFAAMTQLAQNLDDQIKAAVGESVAPVKAKAVPTAGKFPLVTLDLLKDLALGTASAGNAFVNLLKAADVSGERLDDAAAFLDDFLTKAAGQSFEDQSCAPPVLNVLGPDESTTLFAQILTGFEPVTPSRFKAKSVAGVCAVLRGIERKGTVLPNFADHKGRRFSWIVCSNGAMPEQKGLKVLTIIVGKNLDVDKLLALRDAAWAEAAATGKPGKDHDVIGRHAAA